MTDEQEYLNLLEDNLADIVAKQRPRVTVLPDTANDIPINEAVAACQRISADWHVAMRRYEGAAA